LSQSKGQRFSRHEDDLLFRSLESFLENQKQTRKFFKQFLFHAVVFSGRIFLPSVLLNCVHEIQFFKNGLWLLETHLLIDGAEVTFHQPFSQVEDGATKTFSWKLIRLFSKRRNILLW
jgi:hypothetical protein